jgi:hypothetical protein
MWFVFLILLVWGFRAGPMELPSEIPSVLSDCYFGPFYTPAVSFDTPPVIS